MDRLNYKKVLALCTMEDLLRRFSVGRLLRVGKASLRGDCPLPSHRSHAKATFTVNTEKNVWSCTSGSCKPASGLKDGDIIDFVAAMKRCMRPEAARWLSEWYTPTIIGTRANDPWNKSAPSHGATRRGSILQSNCVLRVDATSSRVIRVDDEES